jgi:hypothetical protein
MRIQNIVSTVTKQGLQKQHRYAGYIRSNNESCDLTYLIDVNLPFRKTLFYNNSYWKGNQEFKQPVGIRYEDPLILTCMLPETSSPNFNIINFIRKQEGLDYSSYDNFGDQLTNDFILKKPRTYYSILIKGIKSSSGTENFLGTTNNYHYSGCYVEKILPMKFTSLEPGFQTVSISFQVSMGNI